MNGWNFREYIKELYDMLKEFYQPIEQEECKKGYITLQEIKGIRDDLVHNLNDSLMRKYYQAQIDILNEILFKIEYGEYKND